MKKLFFLLCFSLAVSSIFAQVTDQRISKDTAANADTVTIDFTAAKSRIASIQATVLKVSGTVAGKVYLKGTNDSYKYDTIDSLTLSDISVNSKLFLFDKTKFSYYSNYQIALQTTGTQKSTLRATMLRRPDE